MSRHNAKTQADTEDHRAIMARYFPELYRPATPEELAIQQRPIAGMQYALGQEVSHYLRRETGVAENCTMMIDGRLWYTVAWSNGARTVVVESELREISNV